MSLKCDISTVVQSFEKEGSGWLLNGLQKANYNALLPIWNAYSDNLSITAITAVMLDKISGVEIKRIALATDLIVYSVDQYVIDETKTISLEPGVYQIEFVNGFNIYASEPFSVDDYTVQYRNGIVSNSFFGEIAILDFDAKLNYDGDVTFTVNWGSEIGLSFVTGTMVNDVWNSLQTSIDIPEGVNAIQTVLITDNRGGSFEVGYTIETIKILVTLDMSTPSTAGFNLTFASGSLFMDWDDGGGLVPFVSGVELLKTYVSSGTKNIKISGGLTEITKFIADNSKITFIENFKTGLLTQLDIFTNLYDGILDLSNARVSGRFHAYQNAISSTGITSIIFATSGNGQLTNTNFGVSGLVGNLELSNVTISGLFHANTISGLTGITFATNGNGATSQITLGNNNLTGTLDLSNVPVVGILQAFNNPLLTQALLTNAGNGAFAQLLLNNCDLPDIDISTILTSNNINLDYDNNNLTATEHDNFVIAWDNNGGINGNMDILTGNTARTSASDTAFNNLIAKGWNIN